LEGGTGVNVNLPGTTTRVDGSFHLTYADLPLYLYLSAADAADGTLTNGRPSTQREQVMIQRIVLGILGGALIVLSVFMVGNSVEFDTGAVDGGAAWVVLSAGVLVALFALVGGRTLMAFGAGAAGAVAAVEIVDAARADDFEVTARLVVLVVGALAALVASFARRKKAVVETTPAAVTPVAMEPVAVPPVVVEPVVVEAVAVEPVAVKPVTAKPATKRSTKAKAPSSSKQNKTTP
jgi:hypothetical protein